MKSLYLLYESKYILQRPVLFPYLQYYMHINDITPTEEYKLKYVGYFNDPDEEILKDHDMDCIRAFLNDIEKNGFKYQLAIDMNGIIRDGNCRYWCGKVLNIFYFPINLEFYLGIDMSFYPKKEVII